MSQPPRPDSWQAPDGWQPQWPGWSQPGYQQGYPTAPNQPGGYPSPHPAGGYSQTGTYQPSGAYPVQPPAQPARQFRPVQTLGIWAMVLAAIYTGFFAISALFSPVAAAEYKWALDVGRLEETLTTYDVFALVALLFLLPAAVVGIVWLWRARQNTFVFDPQARHERGDVWVILGWIVPIVSFWFPFQVVRDVVRNSVRRPLGPVLGVWWVTWLIALSAGNLADQQVDTVFSTTSVEGLTAMPFLAILAAIGNIVSVIFWSRIILTVSREQHARAAQRTQPTW